MSNSHNIPIVSLALCAGLALALPSAVKARSAPDPDTTIRIAYRTADIHTAAGAKRLAHRVERAAAEVCDGDDPVMRMSAGFATCQAATIRRAVAGLNEPLLAQALGVAPVTLAQLDR